MRAEKIKAPHMKAEELVQLIRRRYPLNRPHGYQSHVVLEQVPDGTGMHHGHWIDVAVFSLWASKGLFRSAFEVKVSRSDFIRELQNPLKHQWALESFHELWFVAPKDVILIDELPAAIGWMAPHGSKLVIKKHAVRNANPKLDDVLLAAFMRAAAKEIDKVSQVTSKDVLEESEEYQAAQRYREGVDAFLTQRGLRKYNPPATADELVAWLSDATMDKQLKEDRQHLLEVAGRFQREIVSLLQLFLIIANKSLLARDELGRYIVSGLGGVDDSESIATLKELARTPRAFDTQKRYIQLIELILNWDKEFNQP